MKLYKIIADYRADCEPREIFYVWGKDSDQAKYKFSTKLPWYIMFKCIPVKKRDVMDVMANKNNKVF